MTLKIHFSKDTQFWQLAQLNSQQTNIRDAAIKLIKTNGFFESIYEIAENLFSDTHISNDSSSQTYIDRILSEAESIPKMANMIAYANSLKAQVLAGECVKKNYKDC